MLDFFISYTHHDQPWAEWIASVLDDAGYRTRIQARDFTPGQDFIQEMQRAASTAERTIAVLSPTYFDSRFTGSEWAAAFVKDPTGEQGLLIPVRVAEFDPPGLLASRIYIDVVGRNEAAARQALLDGVSSRGARPAPYPGRTAEATATEPPRFPGALPAVWNVPFRRNLHFTGRADELAAIGEHFAIHGAVPLAVIGLGGVGKTQLAAEYAHRHTADYDIVWWLRAEDPATLQNDYAALAAQGLEGLTADPKENPSQDHTIAAVRSWLERHHRWLLVFDNVEDLDVLPRLLPATGGHVLITSRSDQDWASTASVLRLDELPVEEAQAFLVARSGQPDASTAAKLAEALGCLPLALEQAASYIAYAGIITYDRYLRLLEERGPTLLDRSRPPSDYGRTITTTWALSLARLEEDSPAAVDLLTLAAFLAPDDLPTQLLTAHATLLPGTLPAVVAEPIDLGEAVAALRLYGLAKTSGDGLFVHRLLQASVRAGLDEAAQVRWVTAAVRLLRASFPDHGEDVRFWEECRRLQPHALQAAAHAERLGVELEATSWLLDRVARYAKGRAQLTEAQGYLQHALEIAERAYGFDHPEVANIHNDLGVVLSDLGLYTQARTQGERALAIREASLGPDHPDTAVSLSNLAGVLNNLGDYEMARSHHERALAIRETTLGPNHPDTAVSLNNLASALSNLGEYDAAQIHAERALAICEATLGPNHPNTAASLVTLGDVLISLGDYDAAQRHQERALGIHEATLGPNHPDTAASLNNLANALISLGDYHTAGRHLKRALAIREATLGPNHPGTAASLNNLARLFYNLGNRPAARTYAERALTINQVSLGPNHPVTAIAHGNLASTLAALGNRPAARHHAERALAIHQATLGPDHPDTGESYQQVGRLLRDAGKRREAHAHLAQALGITEATFGPDHPRTRGIRAELNALRAKGFPVPRRKRKRR